MTKKDYVLIANIIRAATRLADRYTRVGERCTVTETLDYVAVNLASALADANPAFDRAWFLKACGVGESCGVGE